MGRQIHTMVPWFSGEILTIEPPSVREIHTMVPPSGREILTMAPPSVREIITMVLQWVGRCTQWYHYQLGRYSQC